MGQWYVKGVRGIREGGAYGGGKHENNPPCLPFNFKSTTSRESEF